MLGDCVACLTTPGPEKAASSRRIVTPGGRAANAITAFRPSPSVGVYQLRIFRNRNDPCADVQTSEDSESTRALNWCGIAYCFSLGARKMAFRGGSDSTESGWSATRRWPRRQLACDRPGDKSRTESSFRDLRPCALQRSPS